MRTQAAMWRAAAGAIVVAAICAGADRTLTASTSTATLTVQAQVLGECSATNGTLDFLTYDPLSSANADQSATFSVTCTKGTTTSIGLDLGSHASGSTRKMSNGTDAIAYELYSDSGRSTVWGNSGLSLVNLAAAPSNAARTVTIYGRAAGSQNVGVGSYSDSVTITLTF
jgi:spore coat protein U-like protein